MRLAATLLDSIWMIEQAVITIPASGFYLGSELDSMKTPGTS